MKPRDKERLVKFRPALIRGLDLDRVLPPLRENGFFTAKDEEAILNDPRRREQVTTLLNIMEKKKTEVYQKFVEILEEEYPHLYLQLTDWESVDDIEEPIASGSHLDDDWSELHRVRGYLVKEIDAGEVVAFLRKPGQEHISESEEKRVTREDNRERRTEALMDILEMKSPEVYDVFLNAIGDVYPHVYMALTGDACDDDDDW